VRLAAAALEQHDAVHAGEGAPPAPPAGRFAVIDRDGRMGGRGAYLCRDGEHERPRPDCLARAIRRGSVGRTLRATVSLDPKLVESVGR
jgi:predicted RNA-binding protein YlxR (DUF448 family)